MGEWTIAVIDVEEALPPSLLSTIPKPQDPRVPISEPNAGNRTLTSSILADTQSKLPASVSNPTPEVPVSEPTVWTIATKTESTVSESKAESTVSDSRSENTPQPKPTPPSQPRRRYFSDLFSKISTLGRSTQPNPALADSEDTRLDSEPPKPELQYTTVQETMADDNAQIQVHPEPAPVEIHREMDLKSTAVTTSDAEQDSGTYDGVDNVSVSSDNTTNSDLYTDTEDQPEADPESAYEEVNTTEAGNSQAGPGQEGAKTEETTTQQQDDNKGKKEKKKKKTPGCTGNLFSCMKKPGSKKKKETTKKEEPPKDAKEPPKDAEEPAAETKEETEKEEQKTDREEEKNLYEGISTPEGDEGEYVTVGKGEA